MKVSPLSPFQSPLLPPLPVLLPFPLSTSVLLKFNKINNSKNKPFTNITHMYLLVLYITNVTCILKLYYCFQDIFLVLKNFLFFYQFDFFLSFSFPLVFWNSWISSWWFLPFPFSSSASFSSTSSCNLDGKKFFTIYGNLKFPRFRKGFCFLNCYFMASFSIDIESIVITF